MKNLLFFALTIGLVFTSCRQPKPNPPTTDTGAFPSAFYKKLIGTLGNDAITLDLNRLDGQVIGSYYLDATPRLRKLQGTWAADGGVKLEERDEEGNLVARIAGRFTSSTAFEGFRRDAAATRPADYMIHVEETKGGVAAIKYTHHHKENCARRKQPSSEHQDYNESNSDTLCPYIDILLVEVQTGKAAMDAKINQAIVDAVCGADPGKGSLKEYLGSIDELTEDSFIGYQRHCTIAHSSDNLLCIAMASTVDDGQAYPQQSVQFLNFDLKTGRAIKLDDLMLPQAGDTLLTMVAANLQKTYQPSDGWALMPEALIQDANFQLHRTGLGILYEVKENAPAMAGMALFTLPYASVKHLIKEDGLLPPNWR